MDSVRGTPLSCLITYRMSLRNLPVISRNFSELSLLTAAATAKSFQSCPTLCDPIDGSPLGSECSEKELVPGSKDYIKHTVVTLTEI